MINQNGTQARDRAPTESRPGAAIESHLYLVRDWMTTPVYVIHTNTSVADAYNAMMQRNIRRLPVVDNDKLVGIVTLGDLREARPSPATSLSIYELNYLLAKLTVGKVMTHNPFTVAPDTPIRQTARIMLE